MAMKFYCAYFWKMLISKLLKIATGSKLFGLFPGQTRHLTMCTLTKGTVLRNFRYPLVMILTHLSPLFMCWSTFKLSNLDVDAKECMRLRAVKTNWGGVQILWHCPFTHEAFHLPHDAHYTTKVIIAKIHNKNRWKMTSQGSEDEMYCTVRLATFRVHVLCSKYACSRLKTWENRN